jgi:2-methylcitrate dehydratase
MLQQLAEFVAGARSQNLSNQVREALKIRVLDSLGCALGALNGEPIKMLRSQNDDFGGSPLCSLIGGGRTSPDRAAFYNGALVRYLDYNDSFLAKNETCHPSDNFGPVLAACEYAGGSGKDLLLALAVAYQVQCRLSEVAPVRKKGFDHTTQGAYAAAAGVSKALNLTAGQTANAIAISGTALNALRVTRTGTLSHWKGLAYPFTGFAATHCAFLAMRGITGPPEVFEGNKGFMDAIAGKFKIDWSNEGLERVTKTIIKKYNAEIHSQSATEGILELRDENGLKAGDVQSIEIKTFDVAYNIIGGGEEGSKKNVKTKEEADHSLPYIISAALLDGQVLPEQYLSERINRPDIQSLVQKISVRPTPEYSRRFPKEMPCQLTVKLKDGRSLKKVKKDYEGFVTRPMSWEKAEQKFESLSRKNADASVRRQIVEAVKNLENLPVSRLTDLLRELG